ncbi:MAG TPA: ABC transporter substrate-binding protein [Solirubrobacterales bacterium]|nr:ABC transporter substrate-binding protein [Solirubrobacterales bacterium]
MKLPSSLAKSCLGVLIAAVVILSNGQAAGAAGKGPHLRQEASKQAARTVTGAYTWRPYLDPQVAWSNYSLDVIYDTYIPLLTYRHAGGRGGSEVIPGLARSLPRISDKGRTYTLYLRKGLRYSDGEPVRASDFRFAVERMFRLEFGGAFYGPGHFFQDIVGAEKFARTRRGGIRGIVTDVRTGRITIHLVRPQLSFSRKLAMTFTAPVPPRTPTRNQSFDPPPATGPYVITHSTRRGWTYERNPAWRSHNHKLMPRIPSGHLDTIRVNVVRSAAKAIREVEQGKLDWISEEMSGPAYLSLRHRFPSRVSLEPTLGSEYFWLNTSKPPFDDVRVRRAVNFAVDRNVFSLLAGGQVSPTQQILPPDLPGYRKSSLYPHDMAKARRLIAAANPTVRDITLWTYGEAGDLLPTEFAVYFAAVLHELGFTVHLRVLRPGPYFSMIENPRMANLDAGIGGYYSNYPDPDDFFRETLGSRVMSYYNQNLSQFFVPSLRRMIDRLELRPRPTTPAARYAALDRTYMRLAPWVPIGSISVPLFVSKRIDLGKVVSNPSFGVDLASLRIGNSGASVAEARVQDSLLAPRRTVSVVDTATDRAAAKPIKVGPYASSIAISPGGQRAYVVTSGNGSVAVIDLATNRLVGSPIKVGPYPEGIAVTPDGSRVYAVNSGNNSVSAIDTATDTVVATIKVGNAPTAIAITPDGSHAYVTNTRAGTVSVIDTATNEVDARAIKVGRDPLALVVAPDGGRVYVANIHDDTVSVIRTTTNSVASRTIRTGMSPTSIAITSDGRRLYVANAREDTVSVISTRTGRSAAAPIPVARRPTAIAINPVADRAYMTGMGPGTLSVIDTKTDKLVGEPVEVGPFPLAIAVAPDGRRAYIVHN